MDVDCFPGNETNTGGEIDEAAIQYDVEHAEKEGGSLAIIRTLATKPP
jgi:hypothetical protein